MKKLSGIILLVLAVGALSLSERPAAVRAAAHPAATDAQDLQAFAAIHPIDTHAHVFKQDPAFYTMLDDLHLHILDICVFEDHNPTFHSLQSELDAALGVMRASGGYAAWCTTFDAYKFHDPGFDASAVRLLNQNFAEGAVAVKIWKNVGMEIKGPDGKFVMPDDPAFEPIYRDIASHGKTLVAHLAEPSSCWQPPNPASPDYEYYNEHPEWYMYRHPDHPSKEEILRARDHILAENPHLRVVGAHLGSMETDVDEIARHFDRYPNFAVDTAARVPYLMLGPRDKVRAFLIEYQDRVLYGTDLELHPKEDTGRAIQEWRRHYLNDWKFFATNQTVEYKGHTIQGLALPRSVLRKLYHENAVHWIPGIVSDTP